MPHDNLLAALKKRSAPATSWQSILQLDSAKVFRMHYDQDSQRFLVGLQLARKLDLDSLDVLQQHEIVTLFGTNEDIDGRIDVENLLNTHGQNAIAVFDYSDTKPLGLSIETLPLKKAFNLANAGQAHNNSELYGYPRDYAQRVYNFEEAIARKYAPESLLPISSDQARALIYSISNTHRIMSPDFEIQSLKNIRSFFGDDSAAIACFIRGGGSVGSGKLLMSRESDEGSTKSHFNARIVLHEMAHALTLNNDLRPAHGHIFLYALADLYDAHTALKRDVFLQEARTQGLLPSATNCPPALMQFDTSVQDKFARVIG